MTTPKIESKPCPRCWASNAATNAKCGLCGNPFPALLTGEAKADSVQRRVRDNDQRLTTMKSDTPRTDSQIDDDAVEMMNIRYGRMIQHARGLEREISELNATINTLHNLCVSAEQRAFQKLKEEASAAVSNAEVSGSAREKSKP